MEVEFLVENIEPYTNLLSKIIPTHPQIPILSHILLEATKDGLYLAATDLELGVKIKIPAKIEQEGSTTLPGRQFIDILNSLPKEKASLLEEQERVVLTSRADKITFQTISKDEFPNLFEEKGEKTYAFEKTEFANIFSKLIFAAALDELRPALTGIFINQNGDSLDFVATDGYRLSLKKLPKKNVLKNTTSLLLSSKLIGEALSLKDGLDMYVYQDGNQVLLETDNITLVGRLIDDTFPNYEKVIPASHSTRVAVEREEFLQAIRLASVFARDAANIVKMHIEKEKIHLYSRASGVGEGSIEVDAVVEGDENEISFNAKYLLDFLRNVEEEQVIMELSGPLSPALFRLPKDTNFLHIIMPVRVAE